jgi:hypothetical protein
MHLSPCLWSCPAAQYPHSRCGHQVVAETFELVVICQLLEAVDDRIGSYSVPCVKRWSDVASENAVPQITRPSPHTAILLVLGFVGKLAFS